MGLRIRDATEADLPAIVDIYYQSIPAGWSTADTQPITVADRVDRFGKFDPVGSKYSAEQQSVTNKDVASRWEA